MIAKAEARAIIYHLDAARLAQQVWRAAIRALAEEGAPFRLAAAALDLTDGTVRIESYRSWGGVEMDENLIVLAYADRTRVEDTVRRLSEGCEVPPSAEIVEEEVGRAADSVGISWRGIEMQLRLAYDFDAYEYPPGHEPGNQGDHERVGGER